MTPESPVPAEFAAAVATLDYRPGTIARRVLAKRPGETVTLFAFDQGQEMGEHVSPRLIKLHILEGNAEIALVGITRLLAAGQSLMLPPLVYHAVRAPQRFKMLLIARRVC